MFDSRVALREVKVVRGDAAKPRLAVAVDYYEVLKGSAWSEALATNLFILRDEARMMSTMLEEQDTFYELDVTLHAHLDQIGLRVRTISLHRTGLKNTISLTCSCLPRLRGRRIRQDHERARLAAQRRRLLRPTARCADGVPR